MSGVKIKGSIIKHCRDEFGEIFIADKEGTRSLYFSDGILQSSIRLDRPGSIIEDYNQSIMSSLLFLKEPRSVLLIGLGGCSLVHFLLRTFPGCAVDVVEIRQQVIDLAYEYFLLPRWNPNLRIFHSAGQDFVRQQPEGGKTYDLIIVDAFDDDGPAAALSNASFIDACRARLTEGGICAMNLWHRPKDDFPRRHAEFREVFGGNTLKLFPDEHGWNVIVFGFTGPIDSAALASYRKKARMFEQAYDINFPKYLKYVSWQNFG
ncbi:MAG: spermidine synthase [Thermodesulfovibrionales bacterium]